MSQLREDRFTGRQVLMVERRGRRPSDWGPIEAPEPDRESCPFCKGHEGETPKEVWALRPEGSKPDAPGWQVRVVPNKYPISEPHELIVETPEHRADLPDLPPNQVERVVAAYLARMGALASRDGVRFLTLFKNHGRAAGASRAHPHAQLVGLPTVPPLIQTELERARDALRASGRCLYCETNEGELEQEERLIWADEALVVWCPYAACVPYECWILPRRHHADFSALTSAGASTLARALRETLARLREALGPRLAYNYYVHTAPLVSDRATQESYHWHLEVLPRLGTAAGLEWGTGLYVNPVPPEEAARELKRAR